MDGRVHRSTRHRTEQQKKSSEPEKPEIPTFSKFAERWMEQYVVANRLRDSTAANYQHDLDAHLLPLLGDLRLDQIDVVSVQRLMAARAGRLAASTINKVLGRLKAMLRSAIEWSVITTMPRITMLKEPKLEKPHYKQADDQKLLAAARDVDLKVYTVVRRSPACSERRQDQQEERVATHHAGDRAP